MLLRETPDTEEKITMFLSWLIMIMIMIMIMMIMIIFSFHLWKTGKKLMILLPRVPHPELFPVWQYCKIYCNIISYRLAISQDILLLTGYIERYSHIEDNLMTLFDNLMKWADYLITLIILSSYQGLFKDTMRLFDDIEIICWWLWLPGQIFPHHIKDCPNLR